MNTGNDSSFDEILQIGIVVADLEKTIDTYERVYGIGPWTRRQSIPGASKDLRLWGKPVDSFDIVYAICKLKNTSIELLQPVGENSDYYRYLKEHGEGVHHLAIRHNDKFVDLLESRNIKEVCGGTSPSSGNCFRYMDTRDDLKFITEMFINNNQGDK